MKIFISSFQKEFARERKILSDYLSGDPLFRRFFEAFVFERDVPAADRRPDEVYLDEVAQCDLYLGLFGKEYGSENANGLSPAHLEYNEATRLGKTRLVFVKGASDENKHPKMRGLIREVGNQLIRRRFNKPAELQAAVYASLVDHLEATGKLNRAPWDARAARKATLDDLNEEAIARFVHHARKGRNFPLPATTKISEVLTHLNLLNDGVPTNAAILLFGKYPQRFTLPSEVKCAHFHGTEAAKPIPSYQVYKGTAFELVDQAIDFVMSKINLSVGTRANGPQAPVAYEIPRDVVAEAIVNAVAHRDYNSNGSVQVMLFTDRLEVWNPGILPPALTLEKLRQPHSSIPGNPLLAEPLYLTKYIERMGTGTRDMIALCTAAGLSEPEFTLTDGFTTTIRRPVESRLESKLGSKVGSKVGSKLGSKLGSKVGSKVGSKAGSKVGSKVGSKAGSKVGSKAGSEAGSKAGSKVGSGLGSALAMKLLLLISNEETINKASMARLLGHKRVSGAIHRQIKRLLEMELIEFTIPDKPASRLQEYRLTEKGREMLEQFKGTGERE